MLNWEPCPLRYTAEESLGDPVTAPSATYPLVLLLSSGRTIHPKLLPAADGSTTAGSPCGIGASSGPSSRPNPLVKTFGQNNLVTKGPGDNKPETGKKITGELVPAPTREAECYAGCHSSASRFALAGNLQGYRTEIGICKTAIFPGSPRVLTKSQPEGSRASQSRTEAYGPPLCSANMTSGTASRYADACGSEHRFSKTIGIITERSGPRGGGLAAPLAVEPVATAQ